MNSRPPRRSGNEFVSARAACGWAWLAVGLRALARTVFARVAASPWVKAGVLPVREKMLWRGTESWADRPVELLPFHARCGGYWQDDVNQSRVFLAALVTQPGYYRRDGSYSQPEVMRELLLRPVPLTSWTADERLVAPQMWADLTEEWCRSTNTALRLEGHFQRFLAQPANTLADAQAQGEVLLEVVWEQRTNMVAGVMPTNVWRLVRQVVLAKVRQRPDAREEVTETEDDGRVITSQRTRSDASLLGSFDLRWNERATAFANEQAAELQRKADRIARQQWAEHTEYLRTATTYNEAHFRGGYLHRSYTRTEMEEILPVLRTYAERVKPAVWPKFTVDRITRELNPPTNAVAARPVVQPRPPSPKLAGPAAPAGQTNVLHTAPFWSPSASLFPGRELDRTGLVNLQFADGRIWAGVRYGENVWQGTDLALLSVEPNSLRVETYPLPAHDPGPVVPNRFYFPGFAIAGGQLYVQFGDKLKRLKLGTKEWEELPVSLPAAASFSVVQGRIYFSTADSILELNADATGTRLLASTRRRPAESPLDALASLSSPPVFSGASGVLRVLVGSRLFEQDSQTRGWREAAAALQRPDARREANVLLSSTSQGGAGQTWFGLFDGDSEWRRLYQGVSPYFPQGNPRPGGARPRPEDLYKPALPPAAGADKGAWSLHGTLGAAQAGKAGFHWVPAGDRHCTLMFYPAGRSAPYLIPLELELGPAGQGAPHDARPGNGMNPLTKLIATDVGVILTDVRAPAGFWVLTKAQLEPFIREQEQLGIAQEQARQKADLDQRNVFMKQILAEFDFNKNGVLDPDEERAARKKSAFAFLLDRELIAGWIRQFDTNHDGSLDESEYTAFHAKPIEIDGRPWTPPPFAEAVRLDQNADRRLNVRELEPLLRSAMNGGAEVKKP